MLKRLYGWFYRVTARPDERGKYSGGRLEGMIREETLSLFNQVTGKVLEIGCGAGLFVLKLAARRPDLEIWGVDTNKQMVENLKKRAIAEDIGNLKLELQDARGLKFADESFDRAICVNLFLNINFESVKALLEEMKRVCKRGGAIIFEFRNSRNLLFALKYKLAKFYDDTVPQPLYMHSPDKIEGLLKDMGLKVSMRKPLGFPPVQGLAPIILIEAGKI